MDHLPAYILHPKQVWRYYNRRRKKTTPGRVQVCDADAAHVRKQRVVEEDKRIAAMQWFRRLSRSVWCGECCPCSLRCAWSWRSAFLFWVEAVKC